MQSDQPEVPSSRPRRNRSGRAKPQQRPPWGLIVVGLVLLGIGGRGVYWVIADSWEGFASLQWMKTQGVVLRTGLERSSARGGDSYSLRVVYRYVVEGREYQN